ncbi:hypothetical protein [Rhodococcus opacus]|uniref:hypothetical protein n=1 Tax=Rhodococcus opacus TaxID=37919 RepID=UPI001F547995|nr:hypothetical protein [Rhodococcus opacus]
MSNSTGATTTAASPPAATPTPTSTTSPRFDGIEDEADKLLADLLAILDRTEID